MSRERDFITRLQAFATHPAARGLRDDAAVLPMGARDLVLTHDMLVEGVHYLPDDPPADVAWKLVAVNLSDLAAKGARPIGALMGYMLGRDAAWDAAFADGLRDALAAFALPLLGGDTVAGGGAGGGGAQALGLTAIGETAPGAAPSRAGAQAGDALWVTGPIGAAGLGLAIARGEQEGSAALLAAYRRPIPRLAEGQALAPRVHAMSDVSDGLLIDAARMAAASGLAVAIDLAEVPYVPAAAGDRPARLAAIIAGDDYALLFAAAPGFAPPVPAARIGGFAPGEGLTLHERGERLPPPARLGFEHGA